MKNMNEMMNEMMSKMVENMMQNMMEQMMNTMMQSMMNSMFTSKDCTEEAPKEATKVSAEKSTTTIATGLNDVKCKWGIEELIISGKKFYRITDGIFTLGKWRQSKFKADEEYRIPMNLEAHKLATNKIKSLEGIKSQTTDGGWIAYGFTSKKSAEKALEKLPEKIQSYEIAEYISAHGQIPAKAVTRKKKSA